MGQEQSSLLSGTTTHEDGIIQVVQHSSGDQQIDPPEVQKLRQLTRCTPIFSAHTSTPSAAAVNASNLFPASREETLERGLRVEPWKRLLGRLQQQIIDEWIATVINEQRSLESSLVEVDRLCREMEQSLVMRNELLGRLDDNVQSVSHLQTDLKHAHRLLYSIFTTIERQTTASTLPSPDPTRHPLLTIIYQHRQTQLASTNAPAVSTASSTAKPSPLLPQSKSKASAAIAQQPVIFSAAPPHKQSSVVVESELAIDPAEESSPSSDSNQTSASSSKTTSPSLATASPRHLMLPAAEQSIKPIAEQLKSMLTLRQSARRSSSTSNNTTHDETDDIK